MWTQALGGMAYGWLTNMERSTYNFIDAYRDEFSVQMMYRLLGVAGAGYYAWREHPVSDRAQEDARLLRLIRASLIRTWQGWLYLAVVLDLFSRKVVGWAVRPTIHRELVLEAVMKAIRSWRPRKALIHSDQGSQYGSDAWRRFCKGNRLEPRMSRRANCWDNAVAESFFSSLKKERIKKPIYTNRTS